MLVWSLSGGDVLVMKLLYNCRTLKFQSPSADARVTLRENLKQPNHLKSNIEQLCQLRMDIFLLQNSRFQYRENHNHNTFTSLQCSCAKQTVEHHSLSNQ
jgi:hypothetical protein